MIPSRLKSSLRAAFLGSREHAAPRAALVPCGLQRPEGRRDFLLALPSAPAVDKRPLVVVLHGGGASAEQVMGLAFPPSPLSVWLEIAEREQLVVAAPDAGKGGWNDCSAGAARVAQKDDVGFVEAIVDEAIARHGVDPARVYVIGVSRGGLMAYRIAAEIPQRLAAFSSVLACMPLPGRARAPAAALSALIVGCTDDPLMPYRGGTFLKTLGLLGPVRSIEDSARAWRELAGLPDTPLVTEIAPREPKARTRATHYLWGGAANGLQVGLYRITGAGHAEPSRRQRYPGFINRLVGRQNGDVEIAEAAWEFFRDKRRNISPGL